MGNTQPKPVVVNAKPTPVVNFRPVVTGASQCDLGLKKYNEGRYQEAIACYQEALRLDPSRAAIVHQSLGWSYLKLKDYSSAVTHFETALQQPNITLEGRKSIYEGLGDSYFFLKNYRRSRDYFLQLLNLSDQKHRQALLSVGACFLFLEEHAHALAYFNKVLEENLGDPMALYYRGVAYVRSGQYTLATQDFNKIRERDKNNHLGCIGLALAYLCLDNFQQAMLECENAFQLNSSDSFNHLMRARIKYRLKDYRSALDDINKNIQLNSGNSDYPQAYAIQASCYIELGQLSLALKSIETALACSTPCSNIHAVKGKYNMALAANAEDITVKLTHYQNAKENYQFALASSLSAKDKELAEVDLAEVIQEIQKNKLLAQQRATAPNTPTHSSANAAPPTPPDLSFSPKKSQKSSFSDAALVASHDFQIDYTKRLGAGGFGVVYQGTWSMTPVAIKKLHATELSEEALKNFKEEAARHAPLRHPNIVTLWGVCIEPGHFGMIIELMVAGSLYNLLHSSQPLPWSQRLSIAQQVTIGLNYLHQQGIIHRDLKSLNVLLDQHGQAKLADFGLSTVKSETQRTTRVAENPSTTQAPGTICWMAPELFKRGAKCTVASDIYALGMTFFELASRKAPFQDEKHANNEMLMNWIKNNELDEVPSEAPTKFATLILQCRAHDPNNRLPNTAAVANALAQADIIDQAQQQVSLESGYRWASNA